MPLPSSRLETDNLFFILLMASLHSSKHEVSQSIYFTRCKHIGSPSCLFYDVSCLPLESVSCCFLPLSFLLGNATKAASRVTILDACRLACQDVSPGCSMALLAHSQVHTCHVVVKPTLHFMTTTRNKVREFIWLCVILRRHILVVCLVWVNS